MPLRTLRLPGTWDEMSSKNANPDLVRLHEAAERISANLVELEIDSGRKLLETTRLEGESAARWTAANAALTELWRRQGLLESLLKKADELQSSRSTDQLTSLLRGASIELSTSEVPLAQRNLLSGDERVERCSPGELLASMSVAFDEVKAVVSEIGSAWDRLMPDLDEARRSLRAAVELAGELHEGERPELESARRQVAVLAATVTADPLSVDSAEVAALALMVGEIRSGLEADAALRRSFDARILQAREAIERLRSAHNELRAARAELVVKISVPVAPPLPRLDDDGDRELSDIVAFAEGGAWSQAREAIDALTERTGTRLEEARRLLEVTRVPIEARNQLRALLDAYQVKAKRLGVVEDSDVASAYTRASAALYKAPTDLNMAAQLVRAYQSAINGSPSSSEVAL